MKMALEFSSSRLGPSVVKDEDVQVTKVKGDSPGLLSLADFDGDPMDTEGEDESEADTDVETEQDISLPVQDPTPVSTNREKPFPQIQPKTYGDLHIHTVLQCSCEVMTCRFSDDGTLLAVGLTDGSIKVYSADKGELLHTLRDLDSIVCSLPVTGLSFTHTSQAHSILLATYASGYVRCWYVWGRQCVWWLKETMHIGKSDREEKRQSLCLSISPSGEQAVTGGSDSVIHLYDLNTHQRIQTCWSSAMKTVMDGHSSRVFAVTFHPERETEFISGGWDNTIQFWDTRQEHAVRMLYGPHVCGDALHIDPSTNQILSGSWRKYTTLEVWDYSSGKKVTSVPPDPLGDSMMYTCQWMECDHIVAAGGRANALRILDRHTLTVKSRLFDLPSAVFSSSICPSGKWAGLIAATSGDQVFLLSMDHRKKNTV
ncbi:uncharacterized WD repeat-containing protein all2124-like [Hemibagrus wyckioides]|uniref:uncharacterized WD repeat-containing protein all2124-like n=1 Tax=Hemibagrus wyckioides TaxID=337641 RepID=UPI00266D3B8B|nr:uncharacterized WD repeat-containing protein all2124-like [Hemibagrus wyckioides]